MRAQLLFVVRRAAQVLLVVLAIATFNFVLLHLAPGDAADVLAGEGGFATPEYVAELRAEFGLDRPLVEQYAVFIGKALRLDLGYSPVRKSPVLVLILERLPATALLVFASIGLAIGLGVLFGMVSAMRRGSWFDTIVTIAALLFYATPSFWLGLMLIILFSLKLDVLPAGGFETIGADLGPLAHAADITVHLVLPALTMALYYVAVYTRLMRASMLEVLGLDFIRTARAKGLSEAGIAWSHAARNALMPVVTIAGLQVGHFMGGAVLVETIFGWPGLGRLVFDALLQRDINLLMGIFLVSSVFVILVNLTVDAAYRMIDPRIGAR